MTVFLQSIQSRLVFLIILAILPGLGILILHSIYDRDIAIENALQKAVTTAESITSNQTQIIKDTEDFLKYLASIPEVLTPDSPSCSHFLADTLKLNDNYINLGVPLPNGDLRCSAMPLTNPVNVYDRSYIQKAIATNDFSIGEYQIDRATGVSSINFAYPVMHPNNNQLLGVAVAVVSLSWFSQNLSETFLPNNSVAYIIDTNNNVVADYPSNHSKLDTFTRDQLNTPIKISSSSIKGAIEGTRIIKSPDNHTRVFVSRFMASNDSESPIILHVGIPFDRELKAINKQTLFVLIFILLFTVIIIICAAYGVRRSVLKPLAALSESAKNLELGKNDIECPKRGASELIALQKQFSTMAKTRLEAERKLKENQLLLLESERTLARHIENTPLGCISWDVNFCCTEWNKSAERIFGYGAEEVIGKHVTELILSNDIYREVEKVFTLLLEHKGGYYSINENQTKSGSNIICEWHSTPIESAGGETTGVVSLVQDITERKQMEDKLTTAASVFGHAREGIIITDAAGRIIDINKTFELITGYSRDEVLGKNPNFLTSEQTSPGAYAKILNALKDKGHWYGENWSKRKNKEIYPQLLTISTVYDDNRQVKNDVALFSDITLLKENQAQLEHIAHYDVLTNLPNRTLLADRLKQAIIQSKRNNMSVAIVFIDLDGFKDVNDVHGHSVGDELLISLSARMKETLRDGDTLARFGGDEFVVVLVNLENESDCEPILQRLLDATSDTITIADIVLKVSASIGVTLFPQDSADDGQLIRHADQAMYIAKQSGKNCYHIFDTASDDAIKTKRESIEEIRHALEQKEFVLFYQPKVNMRSGEIIGVEALIRWQHPKRGLLPPLAFLPSIEDQTISIEIGEWVINEALSQITQWQQDNFNMPVSVNIDALQLQQKDFTARLASVLSKFPNINPSTLQLEILETSAFGDIMGVSNIMRSCVDLGVKFAIDDFGTGYSSLTYLRRLPADLIKIDQSFVRDMLEDNDDLAIVIGVVGLATSFHREVIAEGVESTAHGSALLSLGCELAQGYGIARPMPADQLIAWSKTWQPPSEWRRVKLPQK